MNDEKLSAVDIKIGRGSITYTVGTARCGKSTFCDKWVREPSDRPRAIVCADNIRLALHGQRYNQVSEPMVWAIKDYMTEALLSRGHDIIIDGTHTTKESIRRILKVDPNAKYKLINTPKDICIRRAIDTGQVDLIPVIERQHAQLQKLLEEGIDEIYLQVSSLNL